MSHVFFLLATYLNREKERKKKESLFLRVTYLSRSVSDPVTLLRNSSRIDVAEASSDLETQQRREGGGGEETVAKESGGGGARVARTMVGDKLASMMIAALKIELRFEILGGFINDSLEEIGKRGRQGTSGGGAASITNGR
jgi:hypothetical protein